MRARVLKQKKHAKVLIQRSRIQIHCKPRPCDFSLGIWEGLGVEFAEWDRVNCRSPCPCSEAYWGLKIVWKMVLPLFFKWPAVDVVGMATRLQTHLRGIHKTGL